MKPSDVARASLLLRAMECVADVRDGLQEEPETGGVMRLNVQAYAYQGESGGCIHGAILLPVDYSGELLQLIEKKICIDLNTLGVVPETSTRRP